MKDIIVGAITGYNFDAIKPWVNSIERSGFDGDKLMLCYNIKYDVLNELDKRGFKIFAFDKDADGVAYNKPGFNIVVERFTHMAFCMRQMIGQYRYIVSTDVKDVVFQRNPSEWLTTNFGAGVFPNQYKVLASSESIRYKDEDWGNMNLLRSFGADIHSRFENNAILNAGVMAGEFESMLDLFMHIHLLCEGRSHYIEGGGGPDQAAYNVLIGSRPWADITIKAQSEQGWAAQLGTTGPQIQDRYGDRVVEPTPIYKDGLVRTSTGEPFYIVHQYDRVPQWKDDILKRYS